MHHAPPPNHPAHPGNMEQIRRSLRHPPAKLSVDTSRKQAAVALILLPAATGTEVLFIERARHPQDPWSGNLAFPGGRIDPMDANSRQAAERETREEIGLDLTNQEYLGQLDDIAGDYLPVRVSCFVYALRTSAPPIFQLNHEVEDLFFFPLAELANPRRHMETDIHWNDKSRRISAIDLLGPDRPLLWGITYRLIRQFLRRIRLEVTAAPENH
ncbi:MAG: CoA pyrophosphatase [Desulfuromonadaceae bacterium]